MVNTSMKRILHDAIGALDEITFLAKDDDRLVQPHSTSAEQDLA
jgi:hypothetical protein